MISKTLGHYRVIEQLGRGSMGEVCLADDLSLGRKVALKFLPDVFTGDPERMARFEREAKLLASLNHPNIAAIYGLELAEGKRLLVLEYVEGETLAQRLKKGPLPVEEALEVCRQIAEALEAAHENGVIHRDLKPANLMITAGYFTFGLTMAGLLGVIVGGLLLDRVAHGNYRLIMMAGLSIFAVFTFLITVPFIYGSHPLLMICIILAGLGVPFVKACGGPFIVNAYPPRLIGRISGLMTGLGSIAASGGIWLAGKLADRTGRFSTAMILLALVGAAGCILSYFLKQELRVGNHSIAAAGIIDNPEKAPAAN